MKNYVKLMADYGTTGLWDDEGSPTYVGQLPVDEQLQNQIKLWANLYETNDDYLPESERTSAFDVETFAQTGLEIAKAIKTQLPTWTVVYFDEAKLNSSSLEELVPPFVYEITL